MDSVREGEGGKIWENGIETCKISCMKCKIIFADIPRNPTGKIEKPKLRELYGGKGLVEAQNLG